MTVTTISNEEIKWIIRRKETLEELKSLRTEVKQLHKKIDIAVADRDKHMRKVEWLRKAIETAIHHANIMKLSEESLYVMIDRLRVALDEEEE